MGDMTNKFGRGPWSDEPDAMDFEASGLQCAIRRVPWSGHLCGYVGIPPGHPWHAKPYQQIPVETHGGLTFSGDRLSYRPEGEHLYWIGFDCNHLGDMPPRDNGERAALYEASVYRDVGYVRDTTEALARDVAAALRAADGEVTHGR